MTLEEYVNNPIGKNNAVLTVAARENIRANYATKFDNILLRENGKITYYLYEDKKRNVYYIMVKIPSEVVDNFYYETVIKFYADSNVEDLGRNLLKYNVQFFSNDPSFVFTYAHAFLKHDMLIKELAPRMSKQALRQNPDEKNPTNETGYVKSLYFAYLFMKQRGLFNVNIFKGTEPFNPKNMMARIEPADEKIRKRQEEGKKYSSKKKIVVSKNVADKIQRLGVSDETKQRIVTTTSKTPLIKKTAPANKVVNKSKVIRAKRRRG